MRTNAGFTSTRVSPKASPYPKFEQSLTPVPAQSTPCRLPISRSGLRIDTRKDSNLTSSIPPMGISEFKASVAAAVKLLSKQTTQDKAAIWLNESALAGMEEAGFEM